MMEPKTPRKTQVHIQLTPSTKQFMCIVCGEKKSNPKDRQRIMRGSTKTELFDLIEKMLRIRITEEEHSDICCRSCAGRLMTVEKSLSKFKISYESTRERLLRTHGHTTVKRMAMEPGGQSKRKALFMDTSKSTEDTVATHMDNEGASCSITEDREFPYSKLVDALMHGNETLIVNEIMAVDRLASAVKQHILGTLKEEVKHLCARQTNSLLRQCDKEDLLSFSFKDIANEWINQAPLFHSFLISASTNTSAESRNKLKKGDVLLQTQVSAGCKLLNAYSQEMKSLQAVNGILFLKRGMKKSAFNRMQSTNDCQSYTTAIALADKLANDWDIPLKEWKRAVELDDEIEKELQMQISYLQDTIDLYGGQQDDGILAELVFGKIEMEKRLSDHRSSMHPGYYFVGDNVDMVTKVRQMTSSSQNKDQHMYQMCAYVNRVSGNHLDNSKPLQDPKTAPFRQLVPGENEKEEMLTNFSYLVARKWCQHLTHFTPYGAALPDFIEHDFIRETTKCTKRVNMGVLKKNEAKNEDMVDICKFLHKYVPGHDENSNNDPVKTLSGGDYLTFERHRHAQMSLRDDATPSLKLEGLVPKMEEFHNQAELSCSQEGR